MNARPRPFHLSAKPAGDRLPMSDELLETYVRQLLEAPRSQEVTMAWQGGEPTLMGIAFFQRSIEYVEKCRKPGQRILHTMQTSGTLLNDEWCAFFREHRFLVGLKVDGPKEMYAACRVTMHNAGKFDQVMRAWELLRKHEVDVTILCSIYAANAARPLELYRFFRDDLQARYMQFMPFVEPTTKDFLPLASLGGSDRAGVCIQRGGLVTERSVDAEQFGRFLITIFDEWVSRDVGTVFVETFDAALGSWMGQHDLCIFSPTCGNVLALEHNGDLYSCVHYIDPNHRLGNIQQTPMGELAQSKQQHAFGQDKLSSLPKYCRECDVLFACYGECPRNRFITTPDGEPGLNYLCAGYKLFFHHIDSAMKLMAGLLNEETPADEITQVHRSTASS